MKQRILFWLIDNITRWWVAVPALFVSLLLSTSGIIILPIFGLLLAMAVGFLYALNMVDALSEKEKTND